MTLRIGRGALFLIGLTALAAPAAADAAPSPALKPPAPASPYVSPADEAVLKSLFEALDRRRYGLADTLRRDVGEPVARSLADWAYYRSDAEDVPLSAYDAFLTDHPDWPQTGTIQARAEALLDEETPAQAVLSFFGTRDPVTAEGRLLLGRALIETGSEEAGAQEIRRAWIENNWSASEERDILSRFGAVLRDEDHAAKVDRQLFDIIATNSQRLLPLLPQPERREAEARIALLKRDRNALSLYEALPQASKDDAGVLHALTRYSRRADDEVAATAAAGRAPLTAEGLRDPEAWYRERRLLARTALEEGRFEDAYVLSAYSGLENGADFAETEFMAGWIALRFLGEPQRAKAHFAHLLGRVGSPISLSRGHYWLARAHEAAGETEAAQQAYARAAALPFAYYGQLAAERLEALPDTAFPAPAEPGAEALAAFEARPMTRAMRILAEIGEGWAFDRFAHALDDTLEDPGEVLAFASLVEDERKTHLAVRAGKTARRSGASVPQITYPEIALPEGADFVEPALVLGLSRQESEFNPDAYSSAQARGMMQLLSSTARITANKEGIEWAPDRLIGDPSYNMTLGSAHLSHLLERFGGSYVMVLAGYNAGPHRVTQWVDRFGDPRDPNVDPVDWVELIPFSETRNYVMRVLENVQIYRSRLEGGPIAGRLAADLTRGGGAAEAIANSGTSLRLAGRADGRSSVLALPDAAPEAVSALPEAPPPPTLAPNGD